MSVELPSAAEVLAAAYRLVGGRTVQGEAASRQAQVLLGIARELREGSQGRVSDAEIEVAPPRLRRAGLLSERMSEVDLAAARDAFDDSAPAKPWRDPGTTQYLGPGSFDASSYGDVANGETVIIHTEQPMPVPNDRGSIQALVRHDLVERERVGVQRYGTPLQAHNGRDALRDAYEEALDLCCYLRQVIAEREG